MWYRWVSGCVVLFFLTLSNAYALFNPIAYANYLQNLHTQINTLASAARQLQALKNQAKNLGKVSDYQWQNVTQLLDQMNGAMQVGQGMSLQISDTDRQFRQRYPDYTQFSAGQENYQNAYQQWNRTTLDTLRNTLSASAIDANQIHNEEQVLSHLKAQGRSATGRMQALQVSTEIAGENVNQLLQLKQLMMTQMTAQNTYMAYRVSKDSYNEQQLESLVSHVDTEFPGYSEHSGFGVIHEQH